MSMTAALTGGPPSTSTSGQPVTSAPRRRPC